MDVAISPCPNDTFLFFPWIAGYVGKELPITPHYFDIQNLNEAALLQTYPLTKLSFPTYAKVQDHYELLPIGSALGVQNGPKVISKRPYCLEELSSLRIAIPGKETTAHLLCNLFLPKTMKKHFCLYHEVMGLIKNDQVDCGVIIHESRFIFEEGGFHQILDLGERFYEQTKSPLPLGGLALKREYASQKDLICSILSDSLAFAKAYPEKGMEFILEKSQEKERAIVEKHIALYVTEDTAQLTHQGKAAIDLIVLLAL